MSFVPTFKLYASDGVTLVYTFPVVQATNAPQSLKKGTVIEGMRGKGCLIIPGGDSSWDLVIRGVFLADNYTDLTSLINTLETSVVTNTKYVLKIEKSVSTSFDYNVQRIEAIDYPESLRTDYQEYVIRLKVNSW